MMNEFFQTLVSTAAGAATGYWLAYVFAKRQISKREEDDYLALILLLHAHLEHLLVYFSEFGLDMETKTVILPPLFVAPTITEEQVQRLMEISPEKQVPQTLVEILYFCRKAEKGTATGENFCLPFATFDKIKQMLLGEVKDLKTLYMNIDIMPSDVGGSCILSGYF